MLLYSLEYIFMLVAVHVQYSISNGCNWGCAVDVYV